MTQSSIECRNISQEERATLAAEASVLRRLVQHLNGTLSLEKVALAVVNSVVEEIAASNCSLYLLNDEKSEMYLCAARGQTDSYASFYSDGGEFRRFAVGEGVLGWVAREGRPLLLDDVRSEPRFIAASPFSQEVRSLLSVPLAADGKVVGVLNLSHSGIGAFSKRDESLLSLVSAHAGIALSNVRLLRHLARANRRLEMAEEHRREIFGRAIDAFLLIDSTGHIIDANERWAQLAGAPAASWDDVAVSAANGAKRSLKEFLRSEAFARDGVRLEASMERPDGTVRIIELSSKAFPFESQEACFVIIRDITDSRRIAEQLIRSEKLAAIGEVTAALAHEVNNPLGALYNSVCLLKSDLRLAGDNARLLDVAVEEAAHLSEIVTDFLSYARFPHARPDWSDLNEQASNALFLMKRDERMKPAVEVVTRLAGDLAAAQMDKSQFQEVIFNLVSNALDAMNGRGTLTISTYNARLAGLPAVGLLVEDTGVGIPEAHKEKIFAPFFTTKPAGTGLGLAIVKRIVEEHRGTVTVEGSPGRGSKACVVIPVSREETTWR